MTLTHTSTTESQSALEHAASENWREPLPSADAAGAEGKESGTVPFDELSPQEYIEARKQQLEEQKESKNGEAPKKLGGFQKRINRLTAERNALRERLSRYEPSETGNEGFSSPDTAQPNTSAGDPQNDVATRPDSEAILAESQAARETYSAAVERSKGRFSDFDQVVNRRDIQIPEAVAREIVKMGNPEIAYFLGKNPELCAGLTKMSPEAAVAEVGRIAKDLGTRSTGGSHEAAIRSALESEPDGKKLLQTAANIPLTPHVAHAISEQDNVGALFVHLARNPAEVERLNRLPASKALAYLGRLSERLDISRTQQKNRPGPPPPVRPVGGAASESTIPMDQLSPREYIRRRELQIQARRGR